MKSVHGMCWSGDESFNFSCKYLKSAKQMKNTRIHTTLHGELAAIIRKCRQYYTGTWQRYVLPECRERRGEIPRCAVERGRYVIPRTEEVRRPRAAR